MNCDDLLPDSSTSSNDDVCAKQKPSTSLAEFINTDESEVTSSSELENSEWMSSELINFWSILNDDDRMLIEDVFFKDSQELYKDNSYRISVCKEKPHIKDKYEITQERTNAFLLPINCSTNNDRLINALNLDIFPTSPKCKILSCKSDSSLIKEKEDLLTFGPDVFKTEDFKPLTNSTEKLVKYEADEKEKYNDEFDQCINIDICNCIDSLFTEENYNKAMQYLNYNDSEFDFLQIDLSFNDFANMDNNFEYEYKNENNEVKYLLTILLDLLSTDSNSPLYLLKSTFQEYTEFLESQINEKNENEQLTPTVCKTKSKNSSPPKLRRSNRIHENEQRDLADQIRKENQRREQRLLKQFKYTNQSLPISPDTLISGNNLPEHLDGLQTDLELNINSPEISQLDEDCESREKIVKVNVDNAAKDASMKIKNLNPSKKVSNKKNKQKINNFNMQVIEECNLDSNNCNDSLLPIRTAYEKSELNNIKNGYFIKDDSLKHSVFNIKNMSKLKTKCKIQDKRTKFYKMMKANLDLMNSLEKKKAISNLDNSIDPNIFNINDLNSEIFDSNVKEKSFSSSRTVEFSTETKKPKCIYNDLSKENSSKQFKDKRRKSKSYNCNLEILEDKNDINDKNNINFGHNSRNILLTKNSSSFKKEKITKNCSHDKKNINKKYNKKNVNTKSKNTANTKAIVNINLSKNFNSGESDRHKGDEAYIYDNKIIETSCNSSSPEIIDKVDKISKIEFIKSFAFNPKKKKVLTATLS